jgi:hypothetical protein
MPLDHALDDRQPNAGPAEFPLLMQPVEHPEQLVGIPHVKPHPVVPHVHHLL